MAVSKEHKAAYQKKWYAAHPGYRKEKWAALTPEQKEKYRQQKAEYYKLNGDKRRAASREQTFKRKMAVIEAYGGECVCCGETRPQFLSIDHVKGNGRKHVESLGRGRGHDFYRWLRDQGFPKDDFRLLCMNCNFSIGAYGFCPHDRPRFVVTAA